jgi:hypothetical protein
MKKFLTVAGRNSSKKDIYKPKTVPVKGYTRSGIHVKSHRRSE